LNDPKQTEIPGPSPSWITGEDWQTDSFAEAENEKFKDLGPLEKAKQAGAVGAQTSLSFCVRYSIFLGFFIFWAAVVVYSIHILTPWEFLNPGQLDKVGALIFNGTIGAALLQGVKKVML
jgi:hypothetical protein